VTAKLGEVAAARLGPQITRIVARYGNSERAIREIEKAVDKLIHEFKALVRQIGPKLVKLGIPDQLVRAISPVLQGQLFNLFDNWRQQIGDALRATSLTGRDGSTVAIDLYNWLRDKIDAIASRYFPLWTPHITFTVFNDGRVQHRDTGRKLSQALLPTAVSESTSQR